ncbi:MAG: hypothetical protein JRH01_22480 [Deltaproteobacteria bacterium]|nr:hypothetical protein [Deltaproteobacteria bacterium]MBW2421295.1 hypothetical protein [Deltaproteobacteria bacterium]
MPEVVRVTGPMPLDDDTPTDAGRLLSDLAVRDMGPEAIDKTHLQPLYAKIERVMDGSDFEAAAQALPGKGPGMQVDGLSGLIVETRSHRNLPFVVEQVQRELGIQVHLFHGPGNRDFIKRSRIGRLIEEGRVVASELQTETFGALIYNGLFLLPAFWEQVIGRGKILVFQTDTVLCPGASRKIGDFLEFDYIGPSWARGRSGGIASDGGIGGFTLRDWGKTVECLRRFPPEAWPAGEDRYFAFHLELLGARVGRREECARFCTQHSFRTDSLGAHKLNGLSQVQKLRFLMACPCAWRLLT